MHTGLIHHTSVMDPLAMWRLRGTNTVRRTRRKYPASRMPPPHADPPADPLPPTTLPTLFYAWNLGPEHARLWVDTWAAGFSQGLGCPKQLNPGSRVPAKPIDSEPGAGGPWQDPSCRDNIACGAREPAPAPTTSTKHPGACPRGPAQHAWPRFSHGIEERYRSFWMAVQ